jgi:hypothetical protein
LGFAKSKDKFGNAVLGIEISKYYHSDAAKLPLNNAYIMQQ